MKFSLYEIIRVSFKLTSLIATGNYQGLYLQPIVTQYLVCNKSEIWP